MNSERNIINRLMEGVDIDSVDKSIELDEKTYTIGDTQYWKRNGKCYAWTQSGGKKEISDDEYMKALSGDSPVKNTNPDEDKSRDKVDNDNKSKLSNRDILKMDSYMDHFHDTSKWNNAIDNLEEKDARKLITLNKRIKKAVKDQDTKRINLIGKEIEDLETKLGLRDEEGYPISTRNKN